jgi:flagellar biosynthesis protein
MRDETASSANGGKEAPKTADPGRIAIALEYDRKGAPRVTAKGRGHVAAQIIAQAEEHGVAMEENAPLAAALSEVELDTEIPESLYRAVAEILGFILRAGHSRNAASPSAGRSLP